MADNPRFEVLLIVMLCINLVLVFSGSLNTDDKGIIITKFFKVNDRFEVQNINETFATKVEGLTSSGTIGAETNTAFQGFTDTITTLKDLFSLFLSVLTAPFQLLLNSKLALPIAFRWLVGLPLSLMWIFSLIGWLLSK